MKQHKHPVQPVHVKLPGLGFKESKYKIAHLIRQAYGELGIKQGKEALAQYCGLSNLRTVDNWLSIEAGETDKISHLLINKVLAFFNLQEESQLYSDTHNETLKN